MKKYLYPLVIVLLFALTLAACSSGTQPQPQPTEPPAVQAIATDAPAQELAPTATTAAAQPEAAPAVQHKDIPASPPTTGGEKWGDHSTISTSVKGRELAGDDFIHGRFERPYNANTMDVYFPHLDIDKTVVYPEDSIWVYAVITMVGRDSNNSFTGQYAIELDLDKDGVGEFLVIVDNPASTEWTTQGVFVYEDANSDMGGVDPFTPDSAGANSDGYESVIFDQGTGNDSDLAWVRLDPSEANSFQIAYKQSLLGGEDKYTAGIWAGTHLDPALFDYDDHFKYEQAGAANPENKVFYPIKGLSEFDNSCRFAIGYDASGLEPGICPVQ